MESMTKKVLHWMASGETGLSSETMAFTALGEKCEIHHPLDPSDLNRCIKLVHEIPEIKMYFDKISGLSDEWKIVIDNWDVLENMFIQEVGYDWSNSGTAQKTYAFMKKLGL